MMSKLGRCVVPGMLVLFASFVGCGPTTGAYCEDWVSCTGGNEQDEEVCIEMVDLSEEYADIEGCGDEWDELFECVYDNATCQTQQTGQSCANPGDCASVTGAACEGGQCVVKTLALESQEICRQERDLHSSCADAELGIF